MLSLRIQNLSVSSSHDTDVWMRNPMFRPKIANSGNQGQKYEKTQISNNLILYVLVFKKAPAGFITWFEGPRRLEHLREAGMEKSAQYPFKRTPWYPTTIQKSNN